MALLNNEPTSVDCNRSDHPGSLAYEGLPFTRDRSSIRILSAVQSFVSVSFTFLLMNGSSITHPEPSCFFVPPRSSGLTIPAHTSHSRMMYHPFQQVLGRGRANHQKYFSETLVALLQPISTKYYGLHSQLLPKKTMRIFNTSRNRILAGPFLTLSDLASTTSCFLVEANRYILSNS